jgi:hypothetical protein
LYTVFVVVSKVENTHVSFDMFERVCARRRRRGVRSRGHSAPGDGGGVSEVEVTAACASFLCGVIFPAYVSTALRLFSTFGMLPLAATGVAERLQN